VEHLAPKGKGAILLNLKRTLDTDRTTLKGK